MYIVTYAVFIATITTLITGYYDKGTIVLCKRILITWPFMAKTFIWLLQVILSVVYLVTSTNNDPGTWLTGLLKLLK